MKRSFRIIVFALLLTLMVGCAAGDPAIGIGSGAPEKSGVHVGEGGATTEAVHGEATEAPTHAAEGVSRGVPTATVAGVVVVLPTNPVGDGSTNTPTESPTTPATNAVTEAPTTAPAVAATATVGGAVVAIPTTSPTEAPTTAPTVAATATVGGAVVAIPTNPPTEVPTIALTIAATATVGGVVVAIPTNPPTEAPTTAPTIAATATVGGVVVAIPTNPPTEAPTTAPAVAATATVGGAVVAIPTNPPTNTPSTAVEETLAAPTVAATATVAGAVVALPTNPPTNVPTIAVTQVGTEVPPTELVKVTLFLGYIPNIQFAPVYVAFDQGYFRANGIDLTIEHGFDETDGLTRIASGKLEFGMISGEQVLLARAQGAKVKDIYRWYQKFPVGIVSLAKNNLTKPEDLKGKKIGVPGLYGASYVGLQALLNAANLTENDLGSLEAIGFEPVPLICDGKIDASVVYISNEPALLEKTCGAVNVIAISDYANTASNGLVTSEKMLTDNPDLARRMVAAFNQGLAAVIADPTLAYTVSRKYVETLGEDDPIQRGVLAKSIELWKADKLGVSDPAVWKLTAETLVKMGLIPTMPEVDAAYTNEFLPE